MIHDCQCMGMVGWEICSIAHPYVTRARGEPVGSKLFGYWDWLEGWHSGRCLPGTQDIIERTGPHVGISHGWW